MTTENQYPELPDFEAVEQHIYEACRRFVTRDMLEPIYNLMRDYVDADRAMRAQAAPEYSEAMGVAGQAYFESVGKHAHPLPAMWRWSEVYEAMLAAAPSAPAAPQPAAAAQPENAAVAGPSAPVSPMAKMALALREKAAAERNDFDRRVQSGEWGPMPEPGTEADALPNHVAEVKGDDAIRILRWSNRVGAFDYPVGTKLYATPTQPAAPPAVSQGTMNGVKTVHELHSEIKAQAECALLPCPFCGSTNIEIQISTPDREGVPTNLMCSDCGASGPWEYEQGNSHAKADDAWNRRAALQSQDAEDSARLDWLIEQRAYVVSDPDACPGYWINWKRDDGSTWVQSKEYASPRLAIDAARARHQ